jgi:DNA-directed RNA polymerase specialized sigma24 family protein
MGHETLGPDRGELDDFIRAYEAAQASAGQVDLAAFLPTPDHPLYRQVLRELVRVDLEYGWEHGRPKRLEEYQRLFPELFRDPESVQEIAFEEYRLRQQAGENPGPDDYQQRFGVSTGSWAKADPVSDDRPERDVDMAAAAPVGELASLIPNLLADALERLPLHQKAMFDLRIQGCEVAEIAQKTGRSKRTVERILQEVIDKLSDLFGKRD